MSALKLQSSILHVDAVNDLIKYHYHIDIIDYCELIQSTYHDTYLLASENKSYTFKIYNEGSTLKEIEDTCADSYKIVNTNNIKTIKPIKTITNKNYIQVKLAEKNRFCVLWDYFKGDEFLYLSSNDSFLYGKSLGIIHSINNKNRYSKIIDLFDILQKSKNTILNNYLKHDCYTSFNELFDRLDIILRSQSFDGMSMSYCHGDSHGGNVCYDGVNIGFYDIDDSGYGYCLYDIAAFKWMCIQRNNLITWNGFLNGYLSEKKN